MKINERFLNEAKELEARWAKSGLLEGITDKLLRSTTAVLLEGQRLMNEKCTIDLPIATSVFCPRCGTVLEEDSYSNNAEEPVRMQCPGCHYYYQAGW